MGKTNTLVEAETAARAFFVHRRTMRACEAADITCSIIIKVKLLSPVCE